MNNERDRKIEEVLSSLDGIQRGTAPDFFYTRLKARMENSQGKIQSPGRMLRPVYVVAALLLILAINVIVLLRNQNETDVVTAGSDESVQQSIAAEYSLNDNNTVYDLNQDK